MRVVGTSVKGIDHLVPGESHLAEKHLHCLVHLNRRRMLTFPPAHDPMLHGLGAAPGELGNVDHLLDLPVVVDVEEVQAAAMLNLLTVPAGVRTGDVVCKRANLRRLALGRRSLPPGELLDDHSVPPSPAARRAMAARKVRIARAVSAL